MKYILAVFFFLFSFLNAYTQNFKSDFEELVKKNDTLNQNKLLKKWESLNPNDPDLFISYFNFYFNRSRKETMSLGKSPTDKKYLEVKDSTNKTAAYLGLTTSYNPEYIKKGFAYIDKGISIYPNRLDMRFGRIHVLGVIGNYDEFTSKIKESIDLGFKINHNWMWDDDKPLDDPKNFFLIAIQDYVGIIYNTEDDNLLPKMREISENVLKYEPNHVESLSNVATTYLLIGNYAKALEYLLSAEKIAPKDVIVLNNIAESYKRMGEKVNSKTYYEKIIKVGNTEDVNTAKEKIKKL